MTKSRLNFIKTHHKIAILAIIGLVIGFSFFFYLAVLPKINLNANNVQVTPQPATIIPMSVSQAITNLDMISGSNVTVYGVYHSLNGFGVGGCIFPTPAIGSTPLAHDNSTTYIAYGLKASPSYFIKDPNNGQLLTIQMIDGNGKPTYANPALPENKTLTLSGVLKKTYIADCGSNTIISHPSAIIYVVSNQLGIDPKTLPTSTVNIPFTQDPSDKVRVLSVTMSPVLPQINQTVSFDFKIKNTSNSYLLMHPFAQCGVPVPTTASIQFDGLVFSTQPWKWAPAAPLCAIFMQPNYNYTNIASPPGSTVDIITNGINSGSDLIVSNYGTTVGHYAISDSMQTSQIMPFSITGTITPSTTKSSFVSQLSLIPSLCWSC